MINNRNDRNRETEHRIQAGNLAYYKYKSITKRKEIRRKTKMRVYTVGIRSVVTYGAKTMEEEKLRRFERKIYGPKKVVEGIYQRLMNSGVQERLQGEDIVKAIKAESLRWWHGHIRKMGEEKIVMKMTEKSKKKAEKSMGGTDIRGHKNAEIPQLEGKIQDGRSWKRIPKDEQDIRIGT